MIAIECWRRMEAGFTVRPQCTEWIWFPEGRQQYVRLFWSSYDASLISTLQPLRKGIWPGHALDTLQAVDHTRRIQTSCFGIVHRDYDHLREQCVDVLALLNWKPTWFILRLTTSMKFFSFTIAKKSPMFWKEIGHYMILISFGEKCQTNNKAKFSSSPLVRYRQQFSSPGPDCPKLLWSILYQHALQLGRLDDSN